jgi:hypothetical protein
MQLRLLVLTVFALLLGGCGPRWVVLSQAMPDPLVGAKLFYIEPIHFDPPIVGGKSEPEYLAEKDADQRRSWQTDKSETAGRYIAAMVEASPDLKISTQPAPGVFIIRPIVSFIEPGFYAAIVARATEVNMRVQILASNGAPIDEISIRSVIAASMVNAASGTRMREAGEDLGRVTAEYLHKRVAP